MNDPKQLLGIKGASETSSIWKLRIQLMKPITWIPLIWGVICGAAASGNFKWTLSNVLASLACMLMSGPLLAGYTQTINDFFDKEIDAISSNPRVITTGYKMTDGRSIGITVRLQNGEENWFFPEEIEKG